MDRLNFEVNEVPVGHWVCSSIYIYE